MTAPRHALRKDENQAEIVTALERIGCSVVVMHEPCDLLVGYRGKSMLLEIKNPNQPPDKRKLTRNQVIFQADWRGHYVVVQSIDEAIAAVQRHTLTR